MLKWKNIRDNNSLNYFALSNQKNRFNNADKQYNR